MMLTNRFKGMKADNTSYDKFFRVMESTIDELNNLVYAINNLEKRIEALEGDTISKRTYPIEEEEFEYSTHMNEVVCEKCGIDLSEATGYVCEKMDCPLYPSSVSGDADDYI